MGDTKQIVEITVNFAAHDKAAGILARRGGQDGDAFVGYGCAVAALMKIGVTQLSIYKRGLEQGLHEFVDAKSLYSAVNAWEFSELAARKFERDCTGIRRAFYASLYTLSRRKTPSAMDVASMAGAIDDSRKMTHREFRQKYFPKSATVENNVDAVVPSAVDGVDCFERESFGDCSTMADIVAMVRRLSLLAVTYGGESGLNEVLNAVVTVNDETYGADVCTESTETVSALEASAVSAVA